MSASAVVSVGGLLPSDLMGRIGYGDRELVGTAPEAYGLVPGERLTDHVTRSWNRLTGVWANFSTQLAVLSKSERTATSLTRERWLRPLFDELGFGGLSPATPSGCRRQGICTLAPVGRVGTDAPVGSPVADRSTLARCSRRGHVVATRARPRIPESQR